MKQAYMSQKYLLKIALVFVNYKKVVKNTL